MNNEVKENLERAKILSEIKEEVNKLKKQIKVMVAENEQLKARLKKAVEVPNVVGDTVYSILQHIPDDNVYEWKIKRARIEVVMGIKGLELNCCFYVCENQVGKKTYLCFEDKGKYWFNTKEAAEKRIKELKGE
jgi:seryl-tRNA synthetase